MTYDTDDKLRAAIKKAGVQKIAERTGIKPSTLYSFVDGKAKTQKADTREKVLRALNDIQREEAPDLPTGEDYISIPILDVDASAGAGAFVEDAQIIGWQPFRESELSRLTRTKLENLAVISVRGDSMWDTLHHGDHVLVDRTVSRVVEDGIYVIHFEDALLIKRCNRNLATGSVNIQSDNPRYKDTEAPDPEMITVHGRVIWIGRALG